MALVAKRLELEQGQDIHPQKRRRLSVSEVESELQAVGLCQPALSLVRSSENEVQDPGRPMIKRTFVGVDVSTSIDKRRRVCLHREPSHIDITQLAGDAIVPASVGGGCSILPPRCNTGSATIAVDPEGIAFVMGPNGLLIAELPDHLRPVLTLTGVRAKTLAIDFTGTAYFLSEENELLSVVRAVPSIKDNSETEVQLLTPSCTSSSSCGTFGGKHMSDICYVKVEEVDDSFSPSTDVPSSSECEDADMNMD